MDLFFARHIAFDGDGSAARGYDIAHYLARRGAARREIDGDREPMSGGQAGDCCADPAARAGDDDCAFACHRAGEAGSMLGCPGMGPPPGTRFKRTVVPTFPLSPPAWPGSS